MLLALISFIMKHSFNENITTLQTPRFLHSALLERRVKVEKFLKMQTIFSGRLTISKFFFFPPSSFSTLLAFHTPHFPHSHFQHPTLRTPHLPPDQTAYSVHIVRNGWHSAGDHEKMIVGYCFNTQRIFFLPQLAPITG